MADGTVCRTCGTRITSITGCYRCYQDTVLKGKKDCEGMWNNLSQEAKADLLFQFLLDETPVKLSVFMHEYFKDSIEASREAG